MKLIYLSNFFNHHQKPLSDNLYSLLGKDYRFIETECMNNEQRELGYEQFNEPYVVRYTKENKAQIDQMIIDADVVIYGEAPLLLIKSRLKKGLLTIRDDESRYKSYIKYLKWPIYTYNSLYLNKGYLLCASAYGPIDYMLSGMSPNKMFKWGYFPNVNKLDIVNLFRKKDEYRLKYQLDVSILWVGRLIRLKHPESMVYLGKFLKEREYRFNIRIIGVGPMMDYLKKMVSANNLENFITFVGAVESSKVREYMEEADIYVFSSDRGEGWGAVLNESMNSACAVVACNNIGSVPYLIKERINGLTYNDCDWISMFSLVEELICNPVLRKSVGEQAYITLMNVWNANVAARNLLKLISALRSGKGTPIDEGPCSNAPIIFRRTKRGIKTL